MLVYEPKIYLNVVFLITLDVSQKTDIITGTSEPRAANHTTLAPGTSVVVTEVDLNQQKLWPWIGDLKNRIPRETPMQKRSPWIVLNNCVKKLLPRMICYHMSNQLLSN